MLCLTPCIQYELTGEWLWCQQDQVSPRSRLRTHMVLQSALITIIQYISLPGVSPGLLVITQFSYSLLALSLGLGNQLYTRTQLGHNPIHLSLTTLSITSVMETHENDSGVSRIQPQPLIIVRSRSQLPLWHDQLTLQCLKNAPQTPHIRPFLQDVRKNPCQ